LEGAPDVASDGNEVDASDAAVDGFTDGPLDGADGGIEDGGNDAAEDAPIEDAETGALNHPPIAQIDQFGPYTEERTVRLRGLFSHDPDPGDSIVSYTWTWSWGGSITSDDPWFSAVIPCAETAVSLALVVTDNHGAQSAPAIQTITMNSKPGPWVSIDDCVPGDECGYKERPWCSITAGFEHRVTQDDSTLRVVKGRYEQGRTELGGVAIAAPGETLNWDIDAPDLIEVRAYQKVGASPLSAASCDSWATTPEGVVVVASNPDGWSIGGTGAAELHDLCVIGRPVTLPPPPTFRALSFRAGYLLVDGIVRTDTVPPPFPNESVALYCGKGHCDAGGTIIAGSAVDKSVGFQLVDEDPSWEGPRGGLSEATIQFADGATAAETIGLEANCYTLSLWETSIDGGAGEKKSTGISVASGLPDHLTILYTSAFGRGPGESTGLRATDVGLVEVRYSHFQGRAPSAVAVEVETATGVHAINAGVDLIGCDVEGAAEGVTANEAARGVHVQDYLGPMTLFHPGTIRGGRSRHTSVGIDAESSVGLLVADYVIAGGSVQGPRIGEPAIPSVAAGIRLQGAGGELDLRNSTLVGCDPACLDYGVALDDPGPSDELSLLGVGLYVSSDAQLWGPPTDGWTVSLTDGVELAGGRVAKSDVSQPSQAELVGLRALGGHAHGHQFEAMAASSFLGSLDPVNRPWRSAGIRLARSSLVLEDPGPIDGGPAEEIARGIWLTDAQPSAASLSALGASLFASSTSTPMSISGNVSQAVDGRPRRAIGIDDASNPAAELANQVRLIGALPTSGLGWSTVQGGWALPNAQGSVVGVSLDGTSDVQLEHVRIHGGAAGGSQRGMVLQDLRAGTTSSAIVEGCLIEPCGHVDGLRHADECEQAAPGASVGAYIASGAQDPHWPLAFANNLVFGGFNSNGPGHASVALMCAVDDPSGGMHPPARQFTHNLFSGQGATPTVDCESANQASRSEGIRLILEQGVAQDLITSSVAGFANNIIHDGGLACERYAVVEVLPGADLQGIEFRYNDLGPVLLGRDVVGPGYFVAVLQEARPSGSLEHCVLGASAGLPSCLQATAASSYDSNLGVDPGFVASDVMAIIDAPGVASVDGFGTTAVALRAGIPTGVDQDLVGAARSPTIPTVGPIEQQ